VGLANEHDIPAETLTPDDALRIRRRGERKHLADDLAQRAVSQ
jgi:hypothetical protein